MAGLGRVLKNDLFLPEGSKRFREREAYWPARAWVVEKVKWLSFQMIMADVRFIFAVLYVA